MIDEIDRYIGLWENKAGNRLDIEKDENDLVVVSFYTKGNTFVERPFAEGSPSLRMAASYNDTECMLEVELWEKGKGYNILNPRMRFRSLQFWI